LVAVVAKLPRDVADPIGVSSLVWAIGVVAFAVLIQIRNLANKLRARSDFWSLIGGAIHWLLIVIAAPLLIFFIVLIAHIPRDARRFFLEVADFWTIGVIPCAAFVLIRDLANKPRLRSDSWNLIAVAIGWWLLAVGYPPVVGLVDGYFLGAGQLSAVRNLLQMIAVPWPAGVFLFAASINGRILGQGDGRVGLAYGPVSRRPVIASLGALIVSYSVLANVALYKTYPDLLSDQISYATANPKLYLLDTFYIVILGPFAEELFFRGWLWTGLRKHWELLPTAALTSTLWVAIHWQRGLSMLALLVPAAVILAVARHLGQSVRAPIALHLVFNLVAPIGPLLVKGFGLIRYELPVPRQGTKAPQLLGLVKNSAQPYASSDTRSDRRRLDPATRTVEIVAHVNREDATWPTSQQIANTKRRHR
jgi:membrane protease YdiL (CAAX protease family)